jgi:hypothetical protein
MPQRPAVPGSERTRAAPEDRPSQQNRRKGTPYVISGMISNATMFATLIIGLIAGPAVSL